MNNIEVQMPKYKCHKEVWALQIRDIERNTILPWDGRYAPFTLPEEYFKKHSPEIGGYYVIYKDGYKSYSPKEAFEEGYTLIQ